MAEQSLSTSARSAPLGSVSVQAAAAQAADDWLTVCAISLLAGMLDNVVHEGLGHAATALLTGTQSGVLSTVAWSSNFDSRLVAAAGTLANLVAAAVLWMLLRAARDASLRWRYFLLVSMAFNLFTGTGYFFFSGVSNFGDWAIVIDGLRWHGLWRVLLIVVGMASYYGALRVVGIGLVRYVGVPRSDLRRLRKLTWIPYFSSIALATAAGALNPLGLKLVLLSALPATAGGNSGLLWLIYYIPKGTVTERPATCMGRSYAWLAVAAALSFTFVSVLGRGITLHR